jgi:hypothetical protein
VENHVGMAKCAETHHLMGFRHLLADLSFVFCPLVRKFWAFR